MSWTFGEALEVIHELEFAFQALDDSERCHVGLAGGVLMCGESFKDLDIIIYPRKKVAGVSAPGGWQRAAEFIEKKLNCKLEKIPLEFESNYTDEKRVLFTKLRAGDNAGKRIGFFFLS